MMASSSRSDSDAEQQHVAGGQDGGLGHHVLGQHGDEVPAGALQPRHGEVLVVLRQLQHGLPGSRVFTRSKMAAQVGPCSWSQALAATSGCSAALRML